MLGVSPCVQFRMVNVYSRALKDSHIYRQFVLGCHFWISLRVPTSGNSFNISFFSLCLGWMAFSPNVTYVRPVFCRADSSCSVWTMLYPQQQHRIRAIAVCPNVADTSGVEPNEDWQNKNSIQLTKTAQSERSCFNWLPSNLQHCRTN